MNIRALIKGDINALNAYTDSANGDDTLPTRGAIAIATLCLISVLIALRLSLHFCCKRYIVPRFGGIPMGMGVRDFSQSTYAWTPFVIGMIGIGLKVASFAVDQWDFDIATEAYFTVDYRFGILDAEASVPGGDSTKRSYKSICDSLADAGRSSQLTMCRTLMASSALILAAGILSLLLMVIYAIFAARVIHRSDLFASSVVKMYQLSNMSFFLTWGATMFWATSSHLVINELFELGLFGISWYLMLVSMFADLALVWWYRRAIRSMPENGQPTVTTGFLPLPGQAGAVPQYGMPVAQPYAAPVVQPYGQQYYAQQPQGYPTQQYVPPQPRY